MFLGSQEVTYLKISKNLKIVTTPKRKPYFSLPRGPQNPPKIDPKRLPRALYILGPFLDTPKNRARGVPEGLLNWFFNKNVKFWAPTWPPRWAQDRLRKGSWKGSRGQGLPKTRLWLSKGPPPPPEGQILEDFHRILAVRALSKRTGGRRRTRRTKHNLHGGLQKKTGF